MVDVTLHLGDCLDYMRTMDAGSVDAVVTDPPWITSSANISANVTGGVGQRKLETRSLEYGSIGYWNIDAISEMLRIASHDVFIVSGWKELPQLLPICEPLRGLFVWHKPNGMPTLSYPAKMDIAYVVWTGKQSHLYGYQIWPSMVWSHAVPPAGCFASERVLGDGGKSAHPAQGPISLYRQMVDALPPGATVFDPFMGSGTTGVACVRTGRNFIGCEIDPTYYAIAQRRIAEAQLQPGLPYPEPQPVARQEAMPL